MNGEDGMTHYVGISYTSGVLTSQGFCFELVVLQNESCNLFRHTHVFLDADARKLQAAPGISAPTQELLRDIQEFGQPYFTLKDRSGPRLKRQFPWFNGSLGPSTHEMIAESEA